MPERIDLPEEVNIILDAYKEYGATAYIVGGCVRDNLIGREVHDWDICTPVVPSKTIDIFREKGYSVIETGLKHGTVTVMINDNPFEITVFRRDGEYSDRRHPDNVEFTSDLEEDLSRRDFTMNAIAYNPETGFVDPFNGIDDIRWRYIRCVEDPTERFREDPLRIMRAIRFSAQTGFTIDFKTLLAAQSERLKLMLISAERKRDELCKMITSYSPFLFDSMMKGWRIICEVIPELYYCRSRQRNPHHKYNIYTHSVYAMCNTKADLILRLTLLFHDIGKPNTRVSDESGIDHFYGHADVGAKMTDEIMRRLRFDNFTRETVVELVRYHDSEISPKKSAIKRWLNRLGEEQFLRLLEVREADIKAQNPVYSEEKLLKIKKIKDVLKEVLEEKSCFTLKDLAVDGYDLIAIGYKPGKELGDVLNELLRLVIDEELQNGQSTLLAEAKRIFSERNIQ